LQGPQGTNWPGGRGGGRGKEREKERTQKRERDKTEKESPSFLVDINHITASPKLNLTCQSLIDIFLFSLAFQLGESLFHYTILFIISVRYIVFL
jgi:hypothetical protein